jgi:hypothetical protein
MMTACGNQAIIVRLPAITDFMTRTRQLTGAEADLLHGSQWQLGLGGAAATRGVI